MLRLERPRKTGSNADVIGSGHNDTGYTPRVFGTHTCYHEIDIRSSDLGLVNGDVTYLASAHVSKLSPWGEFGIDGEGD